MQYGRARGMYTAAASRSLTRIMPPSPYPPPPEERALRLVARRRLGQAERDRLFGVLAGRLRWTRLLARARQAGLMPLLAHHLRSDPGLASAVPPRHRAALEEARLQTVGRNLVLFRALEEALDALHAAGTPVIPLKGAFLIPEVYGGLDRRTASDLDLLVRRKDLRAVDGALRAVGYSPHRSVEHHLGPDADPHVTSAFYRRPDDDSYFIDLHWHLVEIPAVGRAGIYPVPLGRVWEASVDWTYEGRPARALAPVHHLLFLVLHALKHAYSPLLFLADIAETAAWADDADPAGPAAVVREAESWGLRGDLRLAARLTRELLGVTLPFDAALGPGGPPPTFGERFLRRQVLRGREAPAAPYLIYMERLAGWRARLEFARETFFPRPAAIPWAGDRGLDSLGVGERLRRAGRGLGLGMQVLTGGRGSGSHP